MRSSRPQLRLLICLCCLVTAVSLPLVAQTAASASRPAKAQEALNKGVIAAQQQDYLQAIRYFQDARAVTPDDPLIFLNLGLAESKLPGRELRAIAWFGAYLAARPDASNAAAVRNQIAGLDELSKDNLHRLIETWQQGAVRLAEPTRSIWLTQVEEAWGEIGDSDAGLKAANLSSGVWKPALLSELSRALADAGFLQGTLIAANSIEEPEIRSAAQARVATVQAKKGDLAGARSTLALAQRSADLIQVITDRSYMEAIAEAQAAMGDIDGARKTAELIPSSPDKCEALGVIADAQAKAGDLAGSKISFASAIEIANQIQSSDKRDYGLRNIAIAQAQAGDEEGAQRTSAAIQDKQWKASAQSGIDNALEDAIAAKQAPHAPSISDWLQTVVNEGQEPGSDNNSLLNIDPILDLAGFLKLKASSGDPDDDLAVLGSTSESLIYRKNVIDRMLQRENWK